MQEPSMFKKIVGFTRSIDLVSYLQWLLAAEVPS
jgi:hypothetical protein